jgi:glycosyltransferase involved in cell wall biosynthesis
MKKKAPLISVILNCYNGENFLRKAIDSVIKQTYKNWELIFWDNQSSDNSTLIAKSFKDKRIKYFYSNIHTTQYRARNLALKQTKGEFVMFLDCDDYYLKDCLKNQSKLLKRKNIGFACANFFIKFEKKNQILLAFKKKMPEGYILSDLLKNYTVPFCTLIVRKKHLVDLRVIFNNDYNYIGDFDLVIRLASKFKMARSHNPVSIHRVHDNNLSFHNYDSQAQELQKWYNENKNFFLISSNKNFKNILHLINFKKLIHSMIQNNKNNFYYYFKKVPWSLRKLRLIVIFTLTTVFRFKLSNFHL